MRISDDHIGGDPHPHTFVKENVRLGKEGIELVVSGGLKGGVVMASEFATLDEMMYGSITTTAKVSPVPGVCHGACPFQQSPEGNLK
jgi:hypothetical protein